MRKQKDDMQVNVAGLRRNIKNLAHNYSDAQVKVREATSNDPWGPSATIMAEIADLTYNVVAFSEIMQMIWKRLNDHGKNWRHVYKALILLEYLIKTGTEKVAQQCKENIFAIQTLREFVYFEEGKDQGTHVREKAKQLVNLLKDDERLKNERIKALKAKERFAQHPSGFGSDGYIDGPSHRDMPPGWQEEPKPVSELEMVRPQTAGEEELQLQLAMAMSREEAEQEEAKRRSDDVRLQLALSQSEQDFKQQTKKEEPQSHLLDLLDISLSGASISSPPLGAAGGVGADPWGTPARAASQLSDPWSGTSSPPIDPWQPAAMRSAAPSAPLGVVGGVGGASNGDAWALRTQSPSVASGSSTEGWLQSNGGAAASMNGNASRATAAGGDPWLTKSSVGAVGAAAPATATGNSSLNPWMSEGAKVAPQKALSLDDPWAPKAHIGNDDPWTTTEAAGPKKISPDLDEFDIITNRNKTGDLLTNNSMSGSNNNNASLLDEMDPLSLNYSMTSTGAITTNERKPYKTPQAFLGENSSLVNLDNLIKPVVPQTQAGNAAYNPFSDTVIPPKTNLFQQQQPAVPSINQLKQQQPFAMTINQDPWAPVSNTNVSAQSQKNYLIDYDNEEITVDCRTTTSPPTGIGLGTSTDYSNSNTAHLPYSRSDFDVFNTNNRLTEHYQYNNTNNGSHSVDNLVQLQGDSHSSHHDAYSSSYSMHSPVNPIANNNQNDNSNNNNNNNTYPNYQPLYHPVYPPLHPVETVNAEANSYSTVLSASLATTPGVKITPLYPSLAATKGAAGGALFGYGFYDPQARNAEGQLSSSLLSSSTMGDCKLENINNNNNMPWIKPEGGASSNPFLS